MKNMVQCQITLLRHRVLLDKTNAKLKPKRFKLLIYYDKLVISL